MIVAAMSLASFLFCSILMISSGLVRTIQNDARHRYGDFTVCMSYGEPDGQTDFIRQCGGSELITRSLAGYADQNESTFSVWQVSDNWYRCFDCKLSGGRYPDKQNEVLISDSAAEANGLTVGSIISTDLYVRISEDGSPLDERNSFSENEVRQNVGHAEYTVTGFYTDDGRATVSSMNSFCMFTPKDPERSDYSLIYAKVDDASLRERLEEQYPFNVFSNQDYLTTVGYSASGESVYGSIVLLCSLLLLLVAAAIVILIGNAFALTYREQTREFGVLSSAGATSSQIRRLFVLESLWLSLCGILIGTALGVGAVYFCVSQIAPYFLSVCYVTTEFVMPSAVKPVCLSILFTVTISVAAAIFPTAFLKQKSQIELMRDSVSVPKSKRFDRVRSRRIEHFLSERYRLSNLPRFWTVVFSLGLSAMILLLTIGVCNAEISAAEREITKIPYDLSIRMETGKSSDVTDLYAQLLKEESVDPDRSYWYLSYQSIPDSGLSGLTELDAETVSVSEDKFRQIMNGEQMPDVIVCQNTVQYTMDGNKVLSENLSLYETPSFETVRTKDGQTVSVGCLPWQNVSGVFPCFRDAEASLLIIPESSNLLADQTAESGNIFLFAGNHKEICESCQTDPRLSVMDLAAGYDRQKTDAVIMKVFLYLFMAIIFFVCFVNMFFTVYSNHKLREREYLVLQTIGMVPEQNRRMIRCECVKSCLLTLLIGGLATLIISFAVQYFGFAAFSLPLPAMLAAGFLTVLAHCISYLIVNRQINGLNMLEGIREC